MDLPVESVEGYEPMSKVYRMAIDAAVGSM
jgi:hypothetical protein